MTSSLNLGEVSRLQICGNAAHLIRQFDVWRCSPDRVSNESSKRLAATMAVTIPSALKAADIARFAQRAGQVEKAKPVVTYWCKDVFISMYVILTAR